jgi:ribosomal-protein-alanine N-acetyltransferase
LSKFPVIETKRLRLRKPIDEDVKPLFELCQDEAVMLYYGNEPFNEEPQAQKELDWFLKIWREGTGTRWIISLKGKDNFIGEIGFYNYEKKHKKAEIGYKLVRQHWRKGYMSEALESMLDYMYNTMDLNRIQALVDPRNTASFILLEKQGFQREGVLRDYEYERGDYVDLIMLSILRREWESRVPAQSANSTP